MIETLLVIIFIYIFVAHYGKNWFSPPIIEGNTNKECSEALKLSKQNAGNLTYVKDEIDKIKRIEAKMQKLNNNVNQNSQSLRSIADKQSAQAEKASGDIAM